ncbi:MAG: helix-hairpin-helix domain-containing protein [Gemmatimonadetes bacterium]|nr:helix-hairpin-helix domain-containing protein [Gemmatimonadota bacterium]
MSSERRAVFLLIALGIAGVLVRSLVHSGGAPGAVAYHASGGPRSPFDSVAARARRLARPLRKGERIDLDAASREEITRLPRIGPGLAARIVNDREEHGPFGSLEGLDRVSGVGPSVLGAVKPYAAFSGKVAVDRRVGGLAGRDFRDSPILRGTEPSVTSVLRPADPPTRRPAAPVSLNTATVEELAQLPGIGPAKARAIVADRERRGPFRTLDDLTRVPGVGPGITRRLQGRVQPLP